jgi:hypothetical protein
LFQEGQTDGTLAKEDIIPEWQMTKHLRGAALMGSFNHVRMIHVCVIALDWARSQIRFQPFCGDFLSPCCLVTAVHVGTGLN